jgi:hypothetical protein
MSTAGSINGYEFNSITGDFSMGYTTGASMAGLTTDIYFNHDTHYQTGVLVSLNGAPMTSSTTAQDFSVVCSKDSASDPSATMHHKSTPSEPHSHVLITYSGAEEAVGVDVTITRCKVSGECTCRR